MYKIAILGTENSHARAFSDIICKGHKALGGVPYPDFEIVGICGDNPEENKYLAETYGIPEISDDPNAWVGKVDAIMVTARSGAKHVPYAKKYIEAGIPAFIDKPATFDEAEALEMVRLAKKNNVPLCGGSTCGVVDDTQCMKALMKSGNLERVFGGAVSAPVSLKNEWGNFFFYSQHLVQIMCEIFGYDIEAVQALPREDCATFIARYKDYDVSGHYGSYAYSATIYDQNKVYHKDIDLGADNYLREFERFAHMVRSGKPVMSYEELIAPVFILNAIHKSMQTGELVKVNKFEI